VLLGQNVNSYHYRGLDFPGLLGELAAHFPDKRFKFITSHPYDYNDELVRTIADHKNICEYIHLPMQSGSDSMLKKMHRKYTAGRYLDKIRMTREILENPVITTDIMVGFPGETEDDYKKTMDMAETIQFDDAFMYRYSSRRFTLGSYMEAPPEDIRLKRLKHLIKLQNSIKMERTRSLIGMEAEVLIERPSRKSEHDFVGRDRGERMVVVKGKQMPGEICRVRITDISGITPIGIKED
ncbi:MAG: radical SAM protein, partial [candidate division WOR-3 bacterium]|nr:radical SAM protein [candidate division WOR-3 bacterium]